MDSPPVDLDALMPAEHMTGDDAEDTELLKKMLETATHYIRGFRWCPGIDRVYLGYGVGGVVAVFLFHFQEKIDGTEEWLWVIVGDLPSAYLVVVDGPKDAPAALRVYCELMEDWANAILNGQPLDDHFPVEAKPTPNNATSLLNRLDFIKSELLPPLQEVGEE
ncbi:MAG: hypothetical protein WC740_16605 [Verrucomicrobiia bacterium]